MTPRRILFGLGSAVFSSAAALLALQMAIGVDAVRAFYPVVLFLGALIGFLVWYFWEKRSSQGELSPGRVVRSAVIGGAMGAWSLWGYVRSTDRGYDWPLLVFAGVGFVWCAGWLTWFARARGAGGAGS